MMLNRKKLDDICLPFKSDILINKIEHITGDFPLYGAKGIIKSIDSYQQEVPYLSIIKWGAGVGRVSKHEPYTSIVATMQGILPKEGVDINWLYYLLTFMHLGDYTTNAVVPNLYYKDYCQQIVNVPELFQQKEIAKKLDALQRLITIQKQKILLLDELVKARFVEMFGDPRSNPFGFERLMLKETCKVITGNTPSRAVAEYYGDFVEWIKTDNIVSGQLNPTKAAESLSKKGMEAGRTVESGSILMACIAGSIASIGRVCVTDRKVAFNQQINAIVPEKYSNLFLYSLLQISKDYLVEDINMALKGILSKSKLEEKEFVVPPIELQKQFADFVKQVDKSKFEVQKKIDLYTELLNKKMDEYFNSEAN